MKQVLDVYKMVSFDVKSLFTNAPLEKTIEITLERIYESKEINTSISKKEMKKVLTLYSKNAILPTIIQFTNKTMELRWGHYWILSGVFMVELEKNLIPTLNESMTLWRRFVNDRIIFVKNDSIVYVLDQLNNFHERIHFIYEVEHHNKPPFLDALLIKNANIINTTVYS